MSGTSSRRRDYERETKMPARDIARWFGATVSGLECSHSDPGPLEHTIDDWAKNFLKRDPYVGKLT